MQDTKIFSPANMRAAQDLAGYDGLIKHWMESRLTLRYTGGLVRALSSPSMAHISLCAPLHYLPYVSGWPVNGAFFGQLRMSP